MGFLESLKNFLAEKPEYAFLALAIVAIVILFRKLDKSNLAHLKTLAQVAPLADRLCYLVTKLKKRNGGD